jgi:outer membrane receptor for ferrienterochelin and colicin
LVGRIAVAQEPAAPAAPAAETGTLAGVVLDKTTGEPIIEAGVEVVDRGKTVKTDLDGKYSLRLPPGTYQVRFFAPLYQGTRLQNVTIKANQVTKQDVSLAASKANVEVVEVVAQANKAAEATQLIKRKKSDVVSETVSAEAIKKTPDADAAKVVQRTPAVTVKDNKFVFIRGLNERYSSFLLNGSRLPSTDPNRRLVPLDLFPAGFIQSLSIEKTYQASRPGDFSGGLVEVDLREFPEKLEFTTGLSTGGNTQTTGRHFRTYRGGDLDYLGFGSDFRKLPEDVPDTQTFQHLGPADANAIGRSFRNIWNVDSAYEAPPNVGWDISAGNTWGPLGLSIAGLFGNEWVTDKDGVTNQFVCAVSCGSSAATQPTVNQHANFDISTYKTRLAGLSTAEYKIDPNNKVTFRALIDRNTYDSVSFTDGINTQGQAEQQEVLRYTEDQLDFGQLSGAHNFPWLRLDWRTAYSRTTENEPDLRFITYEGSPGKPKTFTLDDSGGDRIFDYLRELLTDSAVDFTVPFSVWSGLQAKFQFGPSYSRRSRTYDLRRFGIDNQSNLGGVNLHAPPETVLAPSNFVPGVLQFQESTLTSDSYDVSQEIAAFYGMFDVPILKDTLRLNAGVRPEYSYIVLNGVDQVGPFKSIKNNFDPLPGVNLVYSPREDMNVRTSWSRTVSRPEFRELSPVLYPSPRFQRQLLGNPDLVESNQENVDLRWEWFFSPLELASVSFFHKTLDRPIERVTRNFSSFLADSVRNAEPGATLEGFELEGRKDFGFLGPRLQNLSAIANYSWVNSRAVVPSIKTDADFKPGGGHTRALQGQAKYTLNGTLEYAHPRFGTYRVLYNRSGRRIDSIGILLPDIIEEPRNQLDAVAIFPVKIFDTPLTLKLAAQNMLDSKYLFTQAGNVYLRYNRGVTVSIGLSYAY